MAFVGSHQCGASLNYSYDTQTVHANHILHTCYINNCKSSIISCHFWLDKKERFLSQEISHTYLCKHEALSYCRCTIARYYQSKQTTTLQNRNKSVSSNSNGSRI